MGMQMLRPFLRHSGACAANDVAVLAIGAKITSIFALATSVGADAANAAILAEEEEACFQSHGMDGVLSWLTCLTEFLET